MNIARRPLTKEELLQRLKELLDNPDKESSHHIADMLLLEYIDDMEITEAFTNLDRWYA